MKNIGINAEGELVCPECMSKNLSNRRTRSAKLLAGASVGVGALAAPKRLQCLACREYFKSPAVPLKGAAPTRSVPSAAPSSALAVAPSFNGPTATIRTKPPEGKIGTFTQVSNALSRHGITISPEFEAHIRGALPAGQWATLPPVPTTLAVDVISTLENVGLLVEIDDESVVAEAQPEPEAAAAPAVSLADELTKLAALRDQGILTDDEFAAQKAKLLG